MDDDARIPIVFDDVAEVADAASDGRGNVATVEEDGTLRIVLPVAQPCEGDGLGGITVCAPAPAVEAEVGAPPEPERKGPVELRLSKNATIAPHVESHGAANGDSGIAAMVTLRIVF